MPRRALVLLGLAATAAAGAFVAWGAAFGLPAGRRLDASALATFSWALRPPLTPDAIHDVARLADLWQFMFAACALVAIAMVRRRWLMAAAVPVVLLSANLATQQLKPALADLRVVDVRGAYLVFADTWPSGHSTAAMSLALCLVMVAGPRLRPLAALLGAGYAIAIGYAMLVAGVHLPSDVVGGYLVAATFTLLGAAALALAEARWPAATALRPRTAVPLGALAPLAIGLAAGTAIAVLLRRPGTPGDIVEHPPAVLAGLAIAGLGLVLTFGLAQVLRR